MMRTMKKSAFAVLALIALVGCKKGSPIVGDWTTTANTGGMTAEQKYTFDAGGNMTMNATITAQGQSFSLGAKGTYTMTDETHLKVSATDMTVDASKTTEPLKGIITKGFQDNKAKSMADFNKEGNLTLTWEGNDKFTTTMQGQAATFTRVK